MSARHITSRAKTTWETQRQNIVAHLKTVDIVVDNDKKKGKNEKKRKKLEKETKKKKKKRKKKTFHITMYNQFKKK